MFIFSGVEHSAAELAAMSPAELTAYRVSEAQMVQMPYLTLAGIVICIGIAIALVRLPRISHDRASAGTLPGLRSVLREPALAGAVIAQFFYVGAQVGVWSFFIDFVKELSPAPPEGTAALLPSRPEERPGVQTCALPICRCPI